MGLSHRIVHEEKGRASEILLDRYQLFWRERSREFYPGGEGIQDTGTGRTDRRKTLDGGMCQVDNFIICHPWCWNSNLPYEGGGDQPGGGK